MARSSISTISDCGSGEDTCSSDGSICTPTPGSIVVGPIIVHPGGTGVLQGNLNSYTLNQYIVSSGEELDAEVVKDLVTDAVKFSTDTKEKFFPKDDPYSKPCGNKEDLKGFQRRWCILIGALVSLSIITLLTTSLFSLSSLRSSKGDFTTSTQSNPLLDDQTSVLGADLLGAPRMMSRKSWVAQPPVKPLDNNTLPAKMVIVSHTVTDPCFTTGDCILAVRYIQQFHVDSYKWDDIGYSFLIGGDGCVYVGRGWDKMGAHTKGYNNGTLGVAFVGLFSYVLPSESQINAFDKLVSIGVRLGKLSPDYKLVGQCQLQSTASPGGSLIRNMTSWSHFDSSRSLKSCTDLQKKESTPPQTSK